MSEVTVNLELIDAGWCFAPEFAVLRTASRRELRFPTIVGIVRHPVHGLGLFDTGYAPRINDLVKSWPGRLYGMALDFHIPPEADPVAQLAARGIEPADVQWVFLSHFHVDHVGALRDFVNARLIHSTEAWDAVRDLQSVAALRRAYMPALIPDDFSARSEPFAIADMVPLEERYAPFERGADIFGDGSLVAVPLEGHATGQVGLFMRTVERGEVFLCADSCWTSESYRRKQLPIPLVSLAFDDWTAYAASLAQVHDLHVRRPDLPIIPSHCQEAWERWTVG